ncbi:MAG: MBL fold metallo-hydrolase [Burkholderiales bacterium]
MDRSMGGILVQAVRLRARVSAMAQDQDFQVRFWGVRGSIAAPGAATVRYGGNTSCIEVRCGGRLLVLDAGTGLRALGARLLDEAPLDADLFLTHTHFDHVCGLPFFKPFFQPQNSFRLWAGHLGGGLTLQRVMREFMMAPLFPVPPEIFKATVEYRDFRGGETITPAPGIAIRSARLNHPDGATGYRIEYGGRSLCYITDTEHVPGTPDRNVLSLVQGADAVIYDSMYTDEEYARSYVGWGHSTWQEAVRLCGPAGVKKLIAFHHDPEHDDEKLDAIGRELAAAMPGAVMAKEGMELAL